MRRVVSCESIAIWLILVDTLWTVLHGRLRSLRLRVGDLAHRRGLPGGAEHMGCRRLSWRCDWTCAGASMRRGL
jgi:hypothetical protein